MFLRVRLFILRVRIRSVVRRNARAILRATILEAKYNYLKHRYEILGGKEFE